MDRRAPSGHGSNAVPRETIRKPRAGIADEWYRNAIELASWTDTHLVNRRDAFGRYKSPGKRSGPRDTAFTDHSPVTHEVLQDHYRGEDRGDLIGLHSTALDEASGEAELAPCRSRWAAIDIDRHREDEDPEANLRAALAWRDHAVRLGFHPLLIDSNGRGGYHLLVVFDAPVPTGEVFRFAEWLRRDWDVMGLAEKPETFPKQARLGKGKGFGNWLRLPGRHHTRDHWSRVWNGVSWIEGNAAIGFILSISGDPASLIPGEAIADRMANTSRVRAIGYPQRNDADLAREALGYLGPMVDDYATWLEIGMSLTALGSEGLDLWEEWSRSGSKFEDGECARKWASFTRDGRTLGTLFKRAKEAGWPGQGGRNGHHENGHPRAVEHATPPADGLEPWQDPAIGTTPPVVSFPLDAFPLPLAELVSSGAASVPCPPDYFAVVALAVASVAIGRSIALSLKRTWDVSPALYVALVGDPGSAKSPAIKAMTRPLWELNGEHIRRHRDDRKREEAAAKADKRKEDQPPPLKRIVADDVTVESIAPILQDNPRGLIVVRDELTALVASHNQYKPGGKGADRQFFLSAWSGSPVAVDRKHNPDRIPILVPHPFLSVLGGLTTSMLSELSEAKGRDDGFIDRMLFAVPDPVEVRWCDEEVPEDLIEGWHRSIRKLWDVPMTAEEDGTLRPRFVHLSTPARALYLAWHADHCGEVRGLDFPDHLRGPWQKFRDYCARLALIVDRLDWAFDPTAGGQHRDVSEASVRSAIRLVEYFKAHSRRAHALIRGSGGYENEDARAILKWAIRDERRTFSERDVKQNFRARFGGDGPELGTALAWLKARHCIRSSAADDEKKRGRPPTPVYEINPALNS